MPVKRKMTETIGFCERCGAPLNSGSAYCSRCGSAVSHPASSGVVQQAPTSDWREQRRQLRLQRRAERPGPHAGGLVLATIFIVIGLGIFFPELPWSMFWGALVILLGVWVAYLWTLRTRSDRSNLHGSVG